MKFIILFLTLLFYIVTTNAQEQSFFIDFGQASSTTASPDINSNYWNNVTDAYATNYPLKTIILLTSTNVATAIKVSVSANFNAAGNTAPLTDPSSALIGDFAIGTATGDYFYCTGKTGEVTMSGLDPTHSYKFKLFASRYHNSENRTSTYTFTGENQVIGSLQTSGFDIGSDGYDGNNDTVYVSESIAPSEEGIITLAVSYSQGSYGYIGIVEIEDYNVDLYPSSEVLENELFFDFGKNDEANGNSTLGADVNGNYWNNITNTSSLGSPVILVNDKNETTEFSIQITKTMSSNGILNGGLLAPEISKLGDFAIATATQDYFHTATNGAFKISGLNKDHVYKFIMFGSRNSATARVTEFEFLGLVNHSTSHQTTGSGIADNGYSGNDSNSPTTDYMYPDANGDITVNVNLKSGSYAHINAMKVLEYSGIEIVEMQSLSITGASITESGGASQLVETILPVDTTTKNLNWSVDDTSIAIIDTDGLLKPIKNGTVVVTATSVKNPSITTSHTIVISNQRNQLFVAGTQIENSPTISGGLSMKMSADLNETVSNVFEIYTVLNESGDFSFYTTQDVNTAVVLSKDASDGSLLENGTAITSATNGPVHLRVDLNTNTYTVTPITSVATTSNMLPSAWSDTSELTYQGNGIWYGTSVFETSTSETKGFQFRINNDMDWELLPIKDHNQNLVSTSIATDHKIETASIALNYGTYTITLDILNYNYTVSCESISDNKISIMGSSVAGGYGAVLSEGYIYQFNEVLTERAEDEVGGDWKISNISIGGNDTEDVLARWDADLGLDCSTYVVYGLSLGNEGLLSGGQEKYDQFRDNMLLLIQKAKDAGKTPVIMSNYANYYYNTAERYKYIKDMNLLIHQWDVPSVNLLGALDNGTGQWPTAYQKDTAHPNTAGHTELSYAMVPSLFDALEAEKAAPVKYENTYIEMGSSTEEQVLNYTPDAKIHPFTLAIQIKTTGTGEVFTFAEGENSGSVKIDEVSGKLVYTSPTGGQVSGDLVVNDNEWHTLVISHYYAKGTSYLYVDGQLEGELTENLNAAYFSINTAGAPITISYKNWMFYRSGMNQDEISALQNGAMLKSSLELYAPLDSQLNLSTDPLQNLAQSMTGITEVNENLAVGKHISGIHFEMYPNPTSSKVLLKGLDADSSYECILYSITGKEVFRKTIRNERNIELGNIVSGSYLLQVVSLTNYRKAVQQLMIK